MKKCQKCGKEYSSQSADIKEGINSDDNKNNLSKLRLVQSFMGHIDDEMDPINELNICPDCYSILDDEKESKKVLKTSNSKDK
jgi:hypothetical protein